MYVSLYGERSDIKPEGEYFTRTPEGIWHHQEITSLSRGILDAFERLNMKSLQLLFESADQFWNTLEGSDFNIIHAGLDSEALCSRDKFNESVLGMTDNETKRLLYYYSIRHYNHVAQNIVNHIIVSLGDAYAALAVPNLYENVPLDLQLTGERETYRNTVSPLGCRIWTNLNFCIEKIVSFLDFSTKYITDLSNIKPGMTSWKSKASDVSFGKWKHVPLAKGTPLCELSDELRLIMSLRDETVHNGTIDHFSRVYEHASAGKVIRRFVLMPDYQRGRLLTAGGRKRFYSQDNHLNAILPDILSKIYTDTLTSLDQIDEKITPRWDDLKAYEERYPEIFAALKIAEEENVFMKFIPNDKK